MFLVVGGDSEIGRISGGAARDAGGGDDAAGRAARTSQRIVLDVTEEAGWHFAPPAGVTSACILAAVARLGECEQDPAGSARVNVAGTLSLAERLIARGVHVLFISKATRCSTARPRRWQAAAPAAPASEYGKQKARTEAALRAYMQRGAPVAILRLAKVVSPATALLRDWTAALTAHKPIRAFHDLDHGAGRGRDRQVRAMGGPRWASARAGIFQLSGPRDVSCSTSACLSPSASAPTSSAGAARERRRDQSGRARKPPPRRSIRARSSSATASPCRMRSRCWRASSVADPVIKRILPVARVHGAPADLSPAPALGDRRMEGSGCGPEA